MYHSIDAVRVDLPPFISQNDTYIMQYSKFNNFYHYETKRLHENFSAEGFKISSEKSLDFETDANMLKCSNQMYISIQFTCDALNDCPGKKL